MNIDKIEVGMLAKSIAGHDSGKMYVICNKDDRYIYLTDGERRTLDRPKKKKVKHIQVICKQYDMSGIDDVGVKRILKVFDKETGGE